MAPPATWIHESSIIKEDELQELAEFLSRGFRIHHPDVVGGISLSHNSDPQKYMVMHYHSIENGFRLPLHGLCCALDRTPTVDEFIVLFSIRGAFPYYSLFPHPQSPIFERVESKIDKWARCYFVIEFPVHSPIDLLGVVRRSSLSRTPFAAIPLAEAAYNALREKGGLISHHSLQDDMLYKKADFYYPLGPDPIPFEGVSSPERSKAPPVVESNRAGSSSGNQAQGNTTALAICKPSAALDAIAISAIPGLRKPTPSQKRPREGVTDDDFLPKKSKGDELPHPDSLDREADEFSDQAALQRPTVQPQSAVENSSPPTAATSQGMEEEAKSQKEPEAFPAMEKEVGGQKEPDASPGTERDWETTGTGGTAFRRSTPSLQFPYPAQVHTTNLSRLQGGLGRFFSRFEFLQASHWTIQVNLEKMRGSVQDPIIPQARPDLLALDVLYSMEQAQESLLTLTEEYLGGAWGNCRAMVVLKDKELAARALQQKVGSLEQQVQALQEENARLKADGSAELMAERSRVKSLQEQIATYQRTTQNLETQFEKLQEQFSSLESKVSALEGKEGSLKAELVERESWISELENSLQGAKQEGARFSELMLKHLGLKRIALDKMEMERKTANELRSKVGELEKTMAFHQEEVAALTARAETLDEEGKFDMQSCMYEAIQSGHPAHRSLDDLISHYGLPLPLPPPDSRANLGS
ncbi:unnamed protein product [Cuscuta campestris]|uniref:Uncharacterized protein n=1 Tax=Cuscuta campestris TaxID=132261 RepID=A0A484NT67_9ASTE|nr:unnamed protein product [Cuscuta campestris]